MGTDSSHRSLLSKTYSVISNAYQLSLGLCREYEGIKWKVWILSAPEIANLFVPDDRHEDGAFAIAIRPLSEINRRQRRATNSRAWCLWLALGEFRADCD
jgi:hypothetical protein